MAQARRNRKSKTPAWVWLVIGILLGFFFSHVDFLEAYRFLEASVEKSQKSNVVTRQMPKEETKFDFYNILSEKEQNSRLSLKTNKGSDHPSQSQEPDKARQKEPNHHTKPAQVALPPLEKRTVTQLSTLKKPEKTVSSVPTRELVVKPASKETPEAPKKKVVQLIPSLMAAASKEKEIKKIQEDKLRRPEKMTLQIAALRSYSDADRLKAQLLLLGFQGIQVQKIKKGGTVWHRVTVGNYSTQADAESAKKRLRSNNVNAIVVPNK